jgi:hypothetical protein
MPPGIDVPSTASIKAGSRQTLKYEPFFVKTLNIVNKYRSFNHIKALFRRTWLYCSAVPGAEERPELASRNGVIEMDGQAHAMIAAAAYVARLGCGQTSRDLGDAPDRGASRREAGRPIA